MQGFRAQQPVLGCEPLERRDCPAILSLGGLVIVLGTSGADTVDITDDGAGNLSVTLNGTTRTIDDAAAVTVLTLGGNDTINYTLSGDQTGLSAVVVDAGAGDDAVTLTAGNIGGQFGFAAGGGAGADTLTATIGGVTVDATAIIALDGGGGIDTINADAVGEYDGEFALALSGGSGNDAVSGTIDVAAGSTGEVVAVVSGGIGDDDLTLNVTGDGLPELGNLIAVLDGGPGTDTATATDNVTQINIEA